MRGRKATPTALKVAKGTRKDRINTDEPVYASGSIVPPFVLGKDARVMWDDLVPQLQAAQVIKPVHRYALAAMCVTYETWRQDPQNNQARKDFIRLLAEFGLTPTSQTKVQAGEERDAFESFDSQWMGPQSIR